MTRWPSLVRCATFWATVSPRSACRPLGLQDPEPALLRLLPPDLRDDPIVEASLHHALKRGIEQVFQLEETELGVQRVGRGERRALMFYEAAEGGLGVLRRLVEEPDAFVQVIREALRIRHFDPSGRDLKEECRQACYECLLSYANQLESHLLDRHRIRGFCWISPGEPWPRWCTGAAERSILRRCSERPGLD